jgi:hypothetical protein
MGLILWLCVGVIIGMGLISETLESKYQTEAVQRGFAHYNATNGVWQWKEGGAK